MALRYRGTWTAWKDDDAAYRDAMVALANDGAGGTGDVAPLLAAEALFETGGLTWTGSLPASADARRGLALIDNVLARDPENVMANHLCLHLYDFADDRAPAKACAQRLDAAVLPPQAEHLAHMPAHYWIETGNYNAALASSERAYRLFAQLQNVPGRDPDHDRYFSHDVYVGYSAAMMLGDYDVARTWSQRMDAAYGTSYDALTALRFGRYADASALARDATPLQLAVRGLAALQLGDDASARDAADRLRKLTTYGDVVQIFFGTLAQHEGRYDEATRWFDRAVETQRETFAAELIPLLPALEVRGALALQRAAYDDAESAYRDCARGVSERSARVGGFGCGTYGAGPQAITATPFPARKTRATVASASLSACAPLAMRVRTLVLRPLSATRIIRLLRAVSTTWSRRIRLSTSNQ